ncbi:hypothetical protein [Psychroflexus tropicus]|uniref:hypothetical protein n=1 Tax=Psychroflexus tropicus TaxID=197345 RepID=UPI0003A95A09|nr:hypothetical protein [Psychroflexus tropicus]
MKKVFSIIALSAMTLSLSSFNSHSKIIDDPHSMCLDAAADLQMSYLSAGYSWEHAVGAGIEAYSFCMASESPQML